VNKKVIIIVVVAIVVVGGGGGFLLSRHSSNDSTNTMDMITKKSDNSPSATKTATNSVAIEGFAFSPANITVKKGTAVTWTNKDSVAHTVTESDALLGPNSNDIDNGKSYSFTYTQAGTFTYHCAIHPSMTGTVTVTD
jgi:plastocyanin